MDHIMLRVAPTLLVSIALCCGPLAADEARQPNVIVILADDMCLGDLSCFNGGRSRTPNLDRLKRESIWFDQGYSAAPVCAPARAALLTGRYPHRTGVVTLNMNKYPELTQLKRDETTIAELFSRSGYATGLVGKWHCGIGEDFAPTARGFDEFYGFRSHLDVPNYFRFKLTVNGHVEAFRDRYLTEELTSRAIEFVRRHRNQPFFLHVAHYAPHRPLGAPAERIRPYLDSGLSEQTATVYAMIEIMDEGIGQLLRTLEELGLRDSTVVLFASDNGPDPLVEQRFNVQLRGTKYMINEGGIRVPMMLRWPGRLEPGVRDELVHFTDWLPTLCDLANVEVPAGLRLDGISHASPLLGGDPIGASPRFWQWNRWQPRYSHNAAMRDGVWKLVRPYVTRNIPEGPSDAAPQLFRLDRDPQEGLDLADQYPERVEAMAGALQSWSESVERDRVRSVGTRTQESESR